MYVGNGAISAPICRDRYASCSSCTTTEAALCSCTDLCHYFDDCCLGDLPDCKVVHHDHPIIPYQPSDFECIIPEVGINAPAYGVWMVSTCHPSFDDEGVIRMCLEVNENDSLTSLPVLDYNGVNFRNIFCALCNHRNIHDLTPWIVDYECQAFPPKPDLPANEVLVFFTWTCFTAYRSPVPDDILHRRCLKLDAIDESQCHPSHPTYSYCMSYVAHVVADIDSQMTFFKNPHCLMCYLNLNTLNSTEYEDMICDTEYFPGYTQFDMMLLLPGRPLTGRFLPFSVLFDFGAMSRVRVNLDEYIEIIDQHFECRRGEVYDPYLDICRSLECPPGMKLADNQCEYSSSSNITCLHAHDNINFRIKVSFRNESSGNSTPFHALIPEVFGSLVSNLSHEWYIPKETSSSKYTLISSALIDKERIQDVVKRLEYTLNDYNEDFGQCNISEVVLFIECGSHGNSTICEDGWTPGSITTNSAQRMNLSSDGIFNASSAFRSHIQYNRNNDDFFTKTIVQHFCKKRYEQLVCPLNSFNRSLFKTLNSSDGWLEFIPNGKLLGPHEYIIQASGEIHMCSRNTSNRARTFGGNRNPRIRQKRILFSLGQTVLSIIGAIFSLLGCFITLITICAFKSLQNRISPVLGNFIVSLVLAHVLFLAGGDQTQNPTACAIVAMFLHYLWLSSFAWMNILGFDLFVTFGTPCETSDVVPVQRISRQMLFMYLIYGWGSPLLLVGSTIVLHLYAQNAFYGIYGDETACWINNGWANLMLFGVPVSVLLLVNTYFYISVVWGIHKSKRFVKRQLNNQEDQIIVVRKHKIMFRVKSTVQDLKIYVKVSVAADSCQMWHSTFIQK